MSRNRPVTQVERDYADDERLISETDLKGFIRSANASFCAVAGYTHDELVGQRHNIVRHPDVPREVFADFWRTIKAGQRWSGVIKNRCKNGDHYWVKAFVAPIVRDGKAVGYRSVRVKPSRSEIAEAEQLFERIRRGEQQLDTLGDMERRVAWTERVGLGRLDIKQELGLVVAWPLILFAAALAAMNYGASATAGWVLFGIAAATTAFGAYIVITGLTSPLQKLGELAGALENGDLSARLHVYGQSDLSKTLQELDRALDGVELLISEMAQVFGGIARGDLGRRVLVTLPPRLTRVQQAVNDAADQMETTINDLTARLTDLAEGRLRARYDMEASGSGKFREAQERAIVAGRQLSTLLTELIETTRAMSEGDLTRSVGDVGVGDFRTFQEHVDSALTNMREALAAVRANSDLVASGAQEVAASAEEISAGAQSQTEAVRQMKGAIDDVMAAVVHVAEETRAAGERSHEAVTAARDGRSKMRDMVDVIRSIERSSNEIAGITQLIEEVAQQTNLLALNAAIEAARAGEEGRGFAVVAEEVRRLAVRAAESTSEIRTLVDNALAAVHQADAGADEVTAGMDNIEQSVQSTDDLLRTVGDVLQEQRAVLERAGSHVESLMHIAQTNAAVTEELAASAEELQKSAAVMHSQIAQFRVS